MAAVIKALYQPILHPIDAANFTDEDGETHHLVGEPRYKEKLGKKVLILDIDSRPLKGEGQLMNETLKWKGMRPLSAGMLSHYMFGMATHAPENNGQANKLQPRSTATTISLFKPPITPTAGAPGSRSP